VPDFALLIRPAANRVFGGGAAALLEAELRIVAGAAVSSIDRVRIAGVEYVTFAGEPDLADVAALSSTYALFLREGELLRPVELPVVDRYDDDLVTTQRYVGKTNETFTKLLVNVGLALAGGGRRGRVLDPLCGRGTTLNQALMYGCDALGIDVDAKDTHAYQTFLTTWLQEKRLKHQVDATAGRRRFRVTIGRKGAAAGAERQVVDVVTGDTRDAPAYFGKGSVDAIVADLPYGVQHGARLGDALARRPDVMLGEALPAWRAVLRPGGSAALSWNTNVLTRPALVALLEEAGFVLTAAGADGAFVHRVDRTITRDLVVALRPAR
jgi:SAM-dependent methyltransferase